MFVGGHWQHLDVSMGELHQVLSMVRKPQVVVFAPRALGRKKEGNLPCWLGLIIQNRHGDGFRCHRAWHGGGFPPLNVFSYAIIV